MTEPTMIQLRLKADPTRVLPEGRLMPGSELDAHFLVMLDPASAVTNKFPKSSWEPVPPPYALPTGIGAVVRGTINGVATHFVRIGATHPGDTRVWLTDDVSWYSDEMLLALADITTISEGVQL